MFSGSRETASDPYRTPSSSMPGKKSTVASDTEIRAWIISTIDRAAQGSDERLFIRFQPKAHSVIAYTSVCGSSGCKERDLDSLSGLSWNAFVDLFREQAQHYKTFTNVHGAPLRMDWNVRTEHLICADFFSNEHVSSKPRADDNALKGA